ncbi:MAG: M24 family metallopeptidase [Deltaproteobacteria bacterium]
MIFSRHSVLKRGCSTWDKQQMPQAEFESRLDAVRRAMAQQGLDALVIYGDNYAFADLCYLTNYFPKVRGGIGVVPREGPISLLLNIGSRDVPFAKSLTWVEDVRASNQVGRDGAALLKEKGFHKAKVGLVDSGQGFPLPQLEEMKSALSEIQWTASHATFLPMRLKKSARELAALRAAGRALGEICEGAGGMIKTGRKEYQVIADIDRLARDKGVEDIRIMAGGDRLQPPDSRNLARVGNHWTVYLAIQHERYWVEAGQTHILAADFKLLGAYRKAQEVVARMAAQLKPGNAVAAINECARSELGEFYATALLYGLGNGIGLNQWEAPFLSEDEARQVGKTLPNAGPLEENMTLALRVTFESEGKLVLFGDSFEVTASGAVSLIGR